jgi:hypothetical protein
MPSGCREYDVKAVAGRGLPGLEWTLDDIDMREVGEVAAGGGGQLSTDFYARDPIARRASGSVALPVAQPTSSSRSPGWSPATSTSVSKICCGYSGRAS